MRELDQATLGYLDKHYDSATEAERQVFEMLLELQEPELYSLISGKDKDARYQTIIDKIRDSLVNPD